MATNPALNDKIFAREAESAQQDGAFTPGWGSPASELPPGVFNQQPGTIPPGTTQPGSGGPGGYPPAPTGGYESMRMSGTMTASAVLLGLLMVAAWFGWQAVTVTKIGTDTTGTDHYSIDMPPWIFLTVLVGFGIAIVTIMKPKLARITAPLYAIAEGVFLGAISAAYNAQWDGIVLQAVGLTMGVFVMMLVIYATGIIKVTDRFRRGMFAAIGAICLLYLVSFVVSIFGGSMPIVNGNDASLLGIGFSLLVVGVASMNLLLQFDFIEKAVNLRAPRYMEWFAAFGLMVALVWLYLEILRLLARLRSR